MYLGKRIRKLLLVGHVWLKKLLFKKVSEEEKIDDVGEKLLKKFYVI
jgi:hypothetical protein